MSDCARGCTAQEVIDIAKEQGLVVRFPQPNELFLDFDTQEQFDRLTLLWFLFRRIHKGATYSAEWSKSGAPKRHVTVRMPFDVDPKERVLLQALLGSDPVREMLAYEKYKKGAADESLSVFFEKEEKQEEPF